MKIMMRRAFRGCVSALFFAGGCQPDAGAQEPAALASAMLSETIQTDIVYTLPRGAVSVASIRTLPDAVCRLHGADGSADPRLQLRLFSDDDGVVRVHLQNRDPSQEGAALTLDCRDDSGSVITHSIRVVIDNHALPQAAAAYAKTGKPTLAVLDVDPLTLSAAELSARHYPPRPDAAASPAAYAKWLQLVTSAPTFIKPHLASDFGHARSPLLKNPDTIHGLLRPPNWSGYAITTPKAASEFSWIYGEWTVPSVSPESGTKSHDFSVLWVGLDGAGDSVLNVVQDGTEQDTLTVSGMGTASYSAWTEWYPAAMQTLTSFPVNPGDEIHAWTWVRDASDNPSSDPTVGWFHLWNATQNVYSETSTPIPSGVVFSGHCAEWILEMPSVLSPLSNKGLAHYASPTTLKNPLAMDLMGGSHEYTSDTSFNLTMLNVFDLRTLSKVAPVDASTMAFTWVNFR
jgi:hypothetical protein